MFSFNVNFLISNVSCTDRTKKDFHAKSFGSNLAAIETFFSNKYSYTEVTLEHKMKSPDYYCRSSEAFVLVFDCPTIGILL